MYSPETIRKVMAMSRAALNRYLDAIVKTSDIKLTISTGNKKIGRVLNVSTLAGRMCPNCKECIKWCYELKAYFVYPSCLDARARNTAVLLRDRDDYFARIDARINRAHRRLFKAFRWHVGGEIPDADYFDRMVKIAIAHPDWRFWTYTKNYPAVNEWVAAHGRTRDAVPENLKVMFSEWDGMPMINPYGFPVFRCVLVSHGQQFTPGIHRCPGNCEICLEQHRGCPYGQTTEVADH